MPTPTTTQRPRRRWRLLWRTLLFVVVFVVGWYALGRATDGLRRVKVVEDTSAASATAAPPVHADGKPLTVAAYNIAHGRGLAESNWAGDRSDRLGKIADLIASWDADVVVLNEVDLDATWSGRRNQARVIAERAGYAYQVEQCNYDVWLPGFRLRFGNAVLSRYPIVAAEPVDWPGVRGVETAAFGKKRGVVCTLDLGDAGSGGRSVRVVAVHWDARDSAARLGSADVLTALSKDGGPPVIAAGDFNSVLVSDDGEETAVARLLAGSAFSWEGAAAPGDGEGEPAWESFRSDQPDRLIDYVFVQPPLTVERFEAVDSLLSDHRPVVAEVGVGGEE